METRIIRSKNRRKTIGARLENETIIVYAPVNYPEKELERIIEKFKSRFARRKKKKELNAQVSLIDIAQKLNQTYFGGAIKIESIEYSAHQDRIFGVCNYRDRSIRLSYRLAAMPEWVRDYVIMHEMAHILEPNHSPAFWALVNRYSLTERARGYLLAKGEEDAISSS